MVEDGDPRLVRDIAGVWTSPNACPAWLQNFTRRLLVAMPVMLSLVSERFDGIETGGLEGGEVAEDHTHRR